MPANVNIQTNPTVLKQRKQIKPEKTKKLYLELLRIFAIFFVVYVHTGTDGAEHYQIAGDAFFSYWLSLVLACFAQVSVPLFFLISGAVLLQKEESLKTVLTRRVLRMLGVILVFGLIQYAYFYYLNPEIGFSLFVYLKTVYTTPMITQYWYLYTYFSFLLILPFVRMLAASMKNVHFVYFFGLYFLLEGILPIVEYLWGNGRIALSVPLFESALFFPLMGYFIEHRSGDFFYQKKALLFSNLAGLMAVLTNTVVAFMAHRQRGSAETLMGMTAVIALVLFLDARSLCKKFADLQTAFTKGIRKLLDFTGSGVFMVYLLEPPLRDTFRFLYVWAQPVLGWFAACILWIAAAIACGVLLHHTVKKLPLFRRIL